MTLARRQLAKTRKELEQDFRRKGREQLAALRAELKARRQQRRERLREVTAACRRERQRISARAKRARERLNRSVSRTRVRAQELCSTARGAAREDTLRGIENVLQRLQAEAAEQRRYRIWATPGRKTSSAGRTRTERRTESDDEVASNLEDPGLRVVWDAVKHRIKGGARRSRTEAFLEWAAEHTGDVYAIQEADAERHLVELERRERQLAKAMRRRPTRAELAAVPF